MDKTETRCFYMVQLEDVRREWTIFGETYHYLQAKRVSRTPLPLEPRHVRPFEPWLHDCSQVHSLGRRTL